MQNTRPTHNTDLILKDGTSVSCTLKQPTIKMKKEVQKLVVESQTKSELCSALYLSTGPTNQELANAILAGNAEEVTRLEAKLADTVKRVNELNEAQFEIVIRQLSAIVNIPNDGDKKRTTDDIDFEACDFEEMKEAVRFFLNGPKA